MLSLFRCEADSSSSIGRFESMSKPRALSGQLSRPLNQSSPHQIGKEPSQRSANLLKGSHVSIDTFGPNIRPGPPISARRRSSALDEPTRRPLFLVPKNGAGRPPDQHRSVFALVSPNSSNLGELRRPLSSPSSSSSRARGRGAFRSFARSKRPRGPAMEEEAQPTNGGSVAADAEEDQMIGPGPAPRARRKRPLQFEQAYLDALPLRQHV
ncbi:hypothetical protein NL676_004736 [Syzygium grande]|nr:hypothetical protein NL676_004736 [Syzygium grande]